MMAKCQLIDGLNGQKIWDIRLMCSYVDCGYAIRKEERREMSDEWTVEEVAQCAAYWNDSLDSTRTLAGWLQHMNDVVREAQEKAWDAGWDAAVGVGEDGRGWIDNPYRERAN